MLAAVAAWLAIPLVVMLDIRTDTAVAEWWTMNIEAGWLRVVGTITSALPFSVTEFLAVCLIVLCCFLYVRLIVNLGAKRFKRIVTGLLAMAVGGIYLLDLYVLSMAFAYYRAPMPMLQSENRYDIESLKPVVEYFLADYNTLADKLRRDGNGCVECPYDFDELVERIKIEFARLDRDYFIEYTPTAKPLVNSWAQTKTLITGMTFLPFGEATINVESPPSTRTITIAHELAHTKGVFREGDANLLARYILLTADDDYLRYCGYYAAFDNLLDALLLADESCESYSEFYNRQSVRIYYERLYSYEFWSSQPNTIGEISEFLNDLYLKLNGAVNGTGSYVDGNVGGVTTPIDPTTGKPVKDPATEKPIRIINYSQVQKMFFALYEKQSSENDR